MSGVEDSTVEVSINNNESILTYSRSDVAPAQSELLKVPTGANSMWVFNPDIADRYYNLELVEMTADSEIVVNVHGVLAIPGDSMLYSSAIDRGIQIDNHGVSNSYDLKVRFVGLNEPKSFAHTGVEIQSNTSHKINPDWRQFDGHLQVLVDSGFSGVFSDTLYLAQSYLCGDADGSGAVTISDAVRLINYIFASGIAPSPLESGDADGSGAITISDVVRLINYIFASGPDPVCP